MSKLLDSIFTEEQVEKVSEKILTKSIEKINKQITEEVYHGIRGFLFEHYDNAGSDIKRDLIKKMSQEFVKDPELYYFVDFRKRLFQENKEEILEAITDEVIENSIERIILRYTHKSYLFDWKWKEGIAVFILNNWDKFEGDERINNTLLKEIESLKSQVNILRSAL